MAEGNTDHINMESTDGSQSSDNSYTENENESQLESRNPKYWQSWEKLNYVRPKLISVPTYDGLGIHEWRSLEIIRTDVRDIDNHLPPLLDKIQFMESNLEKMKKEKKLMVERRNAYLREMEDLFLVRNARLVSTSEAASTSQASSTSHDV